MDNKKIKVLIGDDSAEYGITCANELRALGLYVVTRRKDGKVILDAIRNDTPDVVVMDAVLPGMDAIEILEKSQTFAHAPAFIITSSYENTFIERQVMEKGAAYFMLKPFHISALGNRITELASNGIPDKEASAHRTLEMVVTEMIHQLGVPAHIKGYHYLRAAPFWHPSRTRHCWRASPRCSIPRWHSSSTPPLPVWSVPSATPLRSHGTEATWTPSIPFSATR